MSGCEIWTIKKAECQRIDAFELWCWRRFLQAPWTTRRSNQSILKEISPKYSMVRVMLKLKLQYRGHFHGAKNWLIWKDPDAGKYSRWEEMRTTEDEMADAIIYSTQWTWVWKSFGRCWWTGKSGGLQSMGSQRVGHDWATELNGNNLRASQSVLHILTVFIFHCWHIYCSNS